MEGGLDMATRKRLANRFRAEYARGTKKQKGEVLDRLVAVGMGRSTARRCSRRRSGPRKDRGRAAAADRSTARRRNDYWSGCGC